jgi:MFS transporter, Spinster family, sphingosine-1-phosphate transporter
MTSGAYKKLMLGILAVALAFNYVDRLALGLVLQNIKADLHLSDTQLGLLTGIAFALFYSLLGIPIARWADRGNRVFIISLTTTLWSVMVALCGAATNFVQLLLIRSGVAIGEAGCIPPALSLISDYFPRAERPRATAIYYLGGPMSMVLGYFAAGWLNEVYGWRRTFLFLGLPGLALAVICKLTLREPLRKEQQLLGATSLSIQNQPNSEGLKICVSLWRISTFRHLLIFLSLVSFFGYGILQWQPAYFQRSFSLGSGELGTWFAIIYGIGGFAGTYLGGELATRWVANDERLQLRLMAYAYCAFAVFSALIYLSPNAQLAFVCMGVTAVGGTLTNGPIFAMLQSLVPSQQRAISIAIIYLCCNLIGMGLGPLVVGTLSDALGPMLGSESLRYALLVFCPGYIWGAWHLLHASHTAVRELQGSEGRKELEVWQN